MEIATMGKVLVRAKIENLDDLFSVHKKLLQPEQVRTIEIQDALVDTGASTLSLPTRLIKQLGLIQVRKKKVRTSMGSTVVDMYGAVRLTIQERDWNGDVIEVPDDCPVLVGQLPLEALDFVVDLNSQRLVGNPAHGGEHILELY
jgi:predicted aspartyl protease